MVALQFASHRSAFWHKPHPWEKGFFKVKAVLEKRGASLHPDDPDAHSVGQAGGRSVMIETDL